jgi:hypothetical protein
VPDVVVVVHVQEHALWGGDKVCFISITMTGTYVVFLRKKIGEKMAILTQITAIHTKR